MTVFPTYLRLHRNGERELPLHFSIHTILRGYAAHRHDFLECSYVLEGSGWEWINGIRYRKEPGSFTFVLPYQVHEFQTDPGSCLKLYNAEFAMSLLMGPDPAYGLRDLLIGDSSTLPSYVQFHGQAQLRMRRLLDELMEEFHTEGLWKNAMVRAKLMEVLVHFDRQRRSDNPQLAGSASPVIPSGNPVHGERALWNVIQYIHMHYQEELSLPGLCATFHISVSHLSEMFKRHAGQTFLQVLHDVRIRHACALLASTDMTMEQVALEVGYGSYKTFARLFKQRKGMPPSDFRQTAFTEEAYP
ncbi:helix-turn-helix domain-containing protein [Paenibacillus koleovorans]|uniref:helix-turn-helix domain-containing protein n=1 Tax=Paenibacillus koleovorans TaxID=121608 RepID=UPI0013E37AC1|nr:AraC family transcriptional regulator [Paenibacillus koleovorans]